MYWIILLHNIIWYLKQTLYGRRKVVWFMLFMVYTINNKGNHKYEKTDKVNSLWQHKNETLHEHTHTHTTKIINLHESINMVKKNLHFTTTTGKETVLPITGYEGLYTNKMSDQLFFIFSFRYYQSYLVSSRYAYCCRYWQCQSTYCA